MACPSLIWKENAGKGLFVVPRPLRALPDRLNNSKYYDFHQHVGHETDSCYALADQIEGLVQGGYFREYVRRRSRSPNQADKGGKTVEEETSKDGNDKSSTMVLGKLAGRLCSIIGGFAGGGVTSSARKKSQRAMCTQHQGGQ